MPNKDHAPSKAPVAVRIVAAASAAPDPNAPVVDAVLVDEDGAPVDPSASYVLPAATPEALGGVKQAEAIADLTAEPTMADFNGLLAKLRASGLLASA